MTDESTFISVVLAILSVVVACVSFVSAVVVSQARSAQKRLESETERILLLHEQTLRRQSVRISMAVEALFQALVLDGGGVGSQATMHAAKHAFRAMTSNSSDEVARSVTALRGLREEADFVAPYVLSCLNEASRSGESVDAEELTKWKEEVSSRAAKSRSA